MISTFFNQTLQWSNFWLQANSDNKNHDIHYFANKSFAAYVYQYPLVGGLKFWYIPRAFVVLNEKETDLENQEEAKLITDLLITIENEAKKNKIIFLKIDFNTNPEFCGIGTMLGGRGYKESTRKIQYIKTKILDLGELNTTIEKGQMEINTFDLTKFWDINQKQLTNIMDKRTRYGVRKGLQIPYIVDFTKDENTFNDFIKLHFSTAQRQGFTTFSFKYFKTLFQQNFTKVLTLRGEDGIARASWVGVDLNGSIHNIIGGNDTFSRENYGQYVLHLAAMNYFSKPGTFYDMGGMEEGKGYDLFKSGFVGENVDFYGPYDKSFNKIVYFLYNLYRKIKSKK